MSEYFVIGGTYQDQNGKEYFALARPSSSEPPYIMVDDIMRYFLIWQNAHLYRLEADYSLTLAAPSPEALELGVKAPERVCLGANLLEKLQAAIMQGTPSDNPNGIGQDGFVRLT